MDDRRAAVEVYFELLDSDPGLDGEVRRAVGPLRSLLGSNPEHALGRLKSYCADVAAALPRLPADRTLSKSIGVETFLRHHAAADVRALIRTPDLYRGELERSHDPAQQAADDLADRTELLGDGRSWLVEDTLLAGLDGAQVVEALGITHRPPLITFVFSAPLLRRHDVRVRPARAVDAVRGEHRQWSPAGLPHGWSEYVDAAVPRAALSEVRRTA